jgi:hypothetical protein
LGTSIWLQGTTMNQKQGPKTMASLSRSLPLPSVNPRCLSCTT